LKKQKYAHLIVTNPPPQFATQKGGPDLQQILMVNDKNVKGSFHVNCAWVWPGPTPGVYEAHFHPHDEILGFIGTNQEDPSDLGAEAELWIDDEKYILNKSFLVFFPKGLVHCPLKMRDVKRPLFHFDIQMSTKPEFTWVKDKSPAK
jgi:hypothetical protein